MTNIEAIKTFFGQGPDAHKVENRECMELSKEERAEIGALCAQALGVTIEAPKQ